MSTTTDNFLELRASWKAAGCPSDHPYFTQEIPSGPVTPLVGGITTEMVEASRAMYAGVSEANVAVMVRRGR